MISKYFWSLIFSLFFIVSFGQSQYETNLKANPIVDGLAIPWDLEWIGNNEILYTELRGTVSSINILTKKTKQLLKISDVANELQTGLMGMALHPSFEKIPEVFLAYTYYKNDELFLKLAVYKLNRKRKKLVFKRTIVDEIVAAPTNVGGRVMTTPDGFIYLTVGEMENSSASQDLKKDNGKVLRFNLDGSVPKSNPVDGSSIFAYGLRNPQGIAYVKGKVYTSEHGTLSDDELNLMLPLKNYGWPLSIGNSGEDKDWERPLKSWTPTIAPCGIAGYEGNRFPFLQDHILIANLVDQSLRAVRLDDTGQQILDEKIFLEEEVGRIRDVMVNPEGRIFICSSNMDSYGDKRSEGDVIYELEASAFKEKELYSQKPADNFLQLENTKLEIRVLTENLVHPWDMTLGPDGWLWLTEAGGFVKRLNPETQEIELMHLFEDVHETKNNPGIYSLAFHPDFKNNPFLFVHYQTEHVLTHLVRFDYDLESNTLSNRKDILPNIIGNESHNGSRIIFTEDQKILFSVGDAYTTERSQDTSLYNGSILRMNIDGSIPMDNPFPNNLIWSYGHRNPQGMAFEPNGNLYSVEHGPANDDELNRIIKGGNYGWPIIKGKANLRSEKKNMKKQTFIQPLITWTPTVAPCGMVYYGYDAIPEWKNSLLVTFLKKGKGNIGQRLGVYKLDKNGKMTGRFTDHFVKKYGRLRAITLAPDGRVFIATSNNEKSGNGKKSIRVNDDRVLELRPIR